MSPKHAAKLYENTRTYGAGWGQCIYHTTNDQMARSPSPRKTSNKKILKNNNSGSFSDKSLQKEK